MLKRWRLAAVAAAGMLALMTFAPRTALAHAQLAAADPAPECGYPGGVAFGTIAPPCSDVVLAKLPTQVLLQFTEEVQPIAGGVTLAAPSGQRVPTGEPEVNGMDVTVSVPPASSEREEGSYVVEWRVISADTHAEEGSYVFSVGRAGTPPVGMVTGGGGSWPLALQALGRWSHFLGYALSFGVLAAGTAGITRGSPEPRRLVGAGLILLVLAEPIGLAAQVASLGNGPQGLLDANVLTGVLGSSFGRALGQRVAAPLLLWVVLGLSGRPKEWLALALGAALAVVDGEADHALSVQPTLLGLGLNGLHVAAMGLWVGGLAVLLLIWRESEAEQSRVSLAAMHRVAGGCAVVLALTGIEMARAQLGNVGDLVGTPYGQTLILKVAVFAGALAVAAGAWRLPALSRVARGWRLGELLLLQGVLAAASLLTSLPPPR